MRVLAPELGPIVTTHLRLFIAGLALVTYFFFIGFDAKWKENWKHFLFVGLINSAIPTVFYTFAAMHIPASYSALINSTSPLFGAIFSAIWLNDKLTIRKVFGILLGALGVGLVAKVGAQEVDQYFGWSVLACLGSTTCYALAVVYIKKFASHVKPMAFAGGSQLLSGLAFLPLIPLSPMPGHFNGIVLINILCLSLLCSALAYVLYYRLIADLGATQALSVTFIIPIFGMLWAFLLLGEQITWMMILGAGLIVGGTWFVMKRAS